MTARRRRDLWMSERCLRRADRLGPVLGGPSGTARRCRTVCCPSRSSRQTSTRRHPDHSLPDCFRARSHGRPAVLAPRLPRYKSEEVATPAAQIEADTKPKKSGKQDSQPDLPLLDHPAVPYGLTKCYSLTGRRCSRCRYLCCRGRVRRLGYRVRPILDA